MRLNRYTYLLDYNSDHFVVFNGQTKDFKLVQKVLQNSYEAILANPCKYITSHPKTLAGLQEIGVLVDDDYNEFEQVGKEYDEYVNENVFKVVILPTYECNYKCWYCTQKHERIELDMHKLDNILLFIKRYIKEHSINKLLLSWFGGEPLTQPNIIDWMSSDLLTYCETEGIEYQAGITSNGALLSPAIIAMLKKNRISGYQIAIDGDKKSHDMTKKDANNSSSFELVLSNVVVLAETYPEANITLRLNITPKVINDNHLVTELNHYIPKYLRGRFYIDIHHIWQIDERKYSPEKLQDLHSALIESGYFLETHNVFSICYVDKHHYACLFYNGKVELCDNKPIDKLRGYITDDGLLKWNSEPVLFNKSIFNPESPCRDCDFLPLCFGGCPSQREGLINKHERIVCQCSNKTSLFEHRIKDYCSRVLNNLKINEV